MWYSMHFAEAGLVYVEDDAAPDALLRLGLGGPVGPTHIYGCLLSWPFPFPEQVLLFPCKNVEGRKLLRFPGAEWHAYYKSLERRVSWVPRRKSRLLLLRSLTEWCTGGGGGDVGGDREANGLMQAYKDHTVPG